MTTDDFFMTFCDFCSKAIDKDRDLFDTNGYGEYSCESCMEYDTEVGNIVFKYWKGM